MVESGAEWEFAFRTGKREKSGDLHFIVDYIVPVHWPLWRSLDLYIIFDTIVTGVSVYQLMNVVVSVSLSA